MTDTNDKLRSLILAALMVFSVFAGTVALSGTAVADHGNEGDAELSSNGTYWQGQELNVTSLEGETTYQIRTNTSDDTSGELEREVTTDSDGHLTIDTSSLDADRYDLVATESGVDDGPTNWEIAVQDIDSSFAEDSVDNSDNGTLVLDSNRGSYNVTVSAEREGSAVSETVLDGMFGDASEGAEADDGTVELEATSTSEIETNFSDVTPGNYTFTVSATDTTASDTANITVNDAAESDVEFTESTYDVPQGDIASITVEFTGDTTQGTLVVGNEDESGYNATIDVQDNDDDGEVTVLFNTYAAGNSSDWDVVEAAGDDDSATLESETNINNILEQGDYGLAVATGDQTTEDTLDEPNDVGTLYINERSTDSANVWTSAEDTSASDITALDAQMTEDSSVALNDWVIVEFTASGLSGLVDAEDNLGSMISVVQTEESTPQNTEAKELDLSNAEFIPDADNDTYYVAIDTGAVQSTEGDSVEAGEEYTAEMTVDDERLVGADNSESVNATFEIVEGEVSIDQPVNVTATEDQSITGSSTYAPGTEFQVRIESTGDTQPRFFESETATVQDDGSWSVTFDRFSQQSAGDTFDVTADGGDAVEGNVVEETTETTSNETTTEVTTTEVTTTEGDVTTTEGDVTTTEGDDDETPTDTDDEETTETDTPGFGVVVALVALVAAALLAVRRD